jgi:urease alpha subunit
MRATTTAVCMLYTAALTTANAVEVMLAPPGKGQGGAARAAAAAASAAATSYLHKEDYGRVPAYLAQVRVTRRD